MAPDEPLVNFFPGHPLSFRSSLCPVFKSAVDPDARKSCAGGSLQRSQPLPMSSAVLILGAGHLPDRQLGPAQLLHDHPSIFRRKRSRHSTLINHFRFHAPDRALIAVIDRGSHWHHHCLADQLDQLLEITPQPSAGDSLLKPSIN